MALDYTVPLPPTRTVGSPNPAPDANTFTAAITEIRSLLDTLENAPGTVSSVNGQTGAVVLKPGDVGAQPAGEFYTRSEVNVRLGGLVTTETFTAAINAINARIDGIDPDGPAGPIARSKPATPVATLLTNYRVKLDVTPVPGATQYAWYEQATTDGPVEVTTEPTRTSGTLGHVTRTVYTYAVIAGFPEPDFWSPLSDSVSIDVTGLDPDPDDPEDPGEEQPPVDPGPVVVEPVGGVTLSQASLFTDAEIASLSTSSAAALRSKAHADAVKSGSYVGGEGSFDPKNVDNRCGPVALTTAIWWQRTGDASYLAPLKTFIAKCFKLPSGVQALNEFRANPGLLAAIEILKAHGQWSNSVVLPNHDGITFGKWLNGDSTLLPFDTRRLNTGGGRWSRYMPAAGFNANEGCCTDSANNWGSVARAGRLLGSRLRGDQAAVEVDVKLFRKFLGDTTTGLADFKSSNDYDPSWNNWPSPGSKGPNANLPAGIGRRDAARPGLDGGVIDDLCRDSSIYSATAAFYGAIGKGRTYPLEAADYIWLEAACLKNMGYDIFPWGDDGFRRMNDRFARVRSGDSQSLLDASEAGSYALYDSGRWIAARLSEKSYGTAPATAGGVTALSRALPLGDWIAGPGSNWGL